MNRIYKELLIVTILTLIISLAYHSFGIVKKGNLGIVLENGQITGEVKQEGIYFIIPILQKVEQIQKH